MADAPDDPDLRERVAELEATVEAQQETIQQLLPSRRRVLQAGGLLAGGGLLGALSADRASADVTGQVGTQQDRVDVFAGQVDANSVNTERVDINGQYAYVAANGGQSNQSIANNTVTDFAFDNIVDTDTDIFSIDISANSITVDVAGRYYFLIQLHWLANGSWGTGSRLFADPQINGSATQFENRYDRKTGVGEEVMQWTYPLALDAGDSLVFEIFQGSGASADLKASSETSITAIKLQ